MSERANDWRSFWDQPHSIYVNARHLDVHYRDIARAIIAQLPGPNARVLDHGCGEAIHADLVAARAAKLILCEAAPSVRARLQERFSANAGIEVLAPEEIDRLPAGCIDLVVANSLVQYISPAELDRLLATWRRLLATDGVLIVADVIPPGVGVVTDTLALLRYAAANGFLLAAIVGLGRTMLSPYRKLRAKLGVSCYGEEEFLARLSAQGFAGERLAFNLEQNPARMTFRARPAAISDHIPFVDP
jgi:SAM-dependent methyltransferase